ncbi:hypothetical protein BTE77_06510 [Ensifer adhaerens]|nr:hypothetical protein BTE77_06510 [Ensifer adhaerens]
MTKKKSWNIWRIKNRPLRAAFTLFVMTPVLAAVFLVTAVVSIIVGIGEGASYAWHVFHRNGDFKKIGVTWWHAVTLGESP